MCKFANEVRDNECKRQYVAHVLFINDEYDVVCNLNYDGTADLVPVNQHGKVNGAGKTYICDRRPTPRMIRDVLLIGANEPCTIGFERI